MRTKCVLAVLSLIVLLGWGLAQEIKPVAVSPGSEQGVARVGERCPTFSWSAVGWAAGYRVAVFEAKAAEVKTFESMVLTAAPVLSREIKGKALSWTPSEGEGLTDGGLYVWYVQARDAAGNGLWSAGRTFLVEADKTSAIGVEERVTKKLRERGIAAGVILEVAKEMRGRSKAGVISREFTLKGLGQAPAGIQAEAGGPGAIRTQGHETDSNTWYGLEAGAAPPTAGFNSFFGYEAGKNTTTGNNNTFVGSRAGYTNNTAFSNTFLGSSTGRLNSAGHSNTFVGAYAGENNTTGQRNTLLGTTAGSNNTTGSLNTFLGYYAGTHNTTGYNNTFVGAFAGGYNQGGAANTMVGYNTGESNSASYCTFLGHEAGTNSTTGYFNTFIGYKAAYSNTTGDYNTALGVNAGYSNASGLRNVFLGYGAGYFETGSDKLYIANSSTTNPLVWGDFSAAIVNINGKLGVGVKSPVYPLQMASGAKCTAGGVWTDASSRSLKENIRALGAEDARAALAQLAPVRFNYKADAGEECLGFIAEDAPSLVATADRKGLSPMDIVAVLTKVLQEQQKINAELRAEIEALKQKR